MTTTREHVLVGVDGSDCGRAALRWAERYATIADATLVLVTAWRWPTSYGVPIGFDGFDPQQDAQHVIEEATASVSLPADRVDHMVVEGTAGDVLVDLTKDAALLVVGTRGHGALTSTILGSTSNHCAHHAHCPIVIVR